MVSLFEKMYPYRQFDSWRDFEELKRVLSEAISRGFVEEVSVVRRWAVPRKENWFKDKETGEIYSLIAPEPPARGGWERITIDELHAKGSI